MKKPAAAMRRRMLELILIVIVAVVLASVVRYFADLGLVPESLVLPINAAIVLIGGYLGIRIVDRLLKRIVEPTLGVTRTEAVKNLFEVASAIVLVVAVFAIFGFNLTAALVGAGFLGIVLGLAAQQVLGNIFAGVSMLVSRPFDIGDRVTLSTSSYGSTGSTYAHESQVSGFTGTVKEVGIFFTRVLLDNGLPVVFPNSVVIGALVVNYSKITVRSVRARIDLDEKVDYDEFKSELLDSLKKHDLIDADKSSVEVVDVGATTYQVAVVAWTKSELEEPIKTIVIREAMKVREELSRA